MNISWVERDQKQYQIIADNFTPVFTEQQFLCDSNIHCCEVSENQLLAAISMVKLDSDLKRLTMLYTFVLPEFRRRGINTMIKECVEVFAKENGANHLLGHVREQNRASINTLLKRGFTIVDEGNLFYGNGDKKLTVKKMLL